MPEYDENYETVGTEDDAGLSKVELHNPAFINPAFIKPLAPQTVLPLTGSNVYGVAQPSKANKPTASLTADDTYNKLSNTRRYSRRKSYDKALDTVGKHEASAPAAPQNCEQFAVCFPCNSEEEMRRLSPWFSGDQPVTQRQRSKLRRSAKL